jgi:malate dehydrogenase
MTRLDQNRGRAQIAERLKVSVGQVKNVIIWGNHSATQVPDANSATVDLGSGPTPVPETLKNDEWLKGEFITVSRFWFVSSAWIFRNLVIPKMSYHHENPLKFVQLQ